MVQSKLSAPIIHIAEATSKFILSQGCEKVGFIGTNYGMQNSFLTKRIFQGGVEVLITQSKVHINELHRIIHEELTYNQVSVKSKAFVAEELSRLKSRGAQGIILGCTEFSLMFEELQVDFPVFDTVEIHSKEAVEQMLMGLSV